MHCTNYLKRTQKVGKFTLPDLGCALLFCLLATLIFPNCALAYVDPSIITYTIQAVAGVAVVMGAVFGVVFRKARKGLLKLLGFDGSSHKNTEAIIHKVDSSGNVIKNTSDAIEEENKINSANSKASAKAKAFNLNFRSRLVVSFLVSLLFVLTNFILPPFELVIGSASSLMFGLDEIFALVIIPSLIVLVVSTFILSFFKGKVFHVLIALVFSLALATYIQSMFLNGGIPAADGLTLDWTPFTNAMILGVIIWTVIFIVPTACILYKSILTRGVLVLSCCALIIVQSVACVTLVAPTQNASSATQANKEDEVIIPLEDYRFTKNGINTVAPLNSPVENVATKDPYENNSPISNNIVFILDMTDVNYVDALLKEQPELYNQLNDFTFFRNSTAAFSHTHLAIPFLLSGDLLQPEQNMVDYKKDRYTSSPFVKALMDNNFSMGLYTDSSHIQAESDKGFIRKYSDYAFNFQPLGSTSNVASSKYSSEISGSVELEVYDKPQMIKVLLKNTLYRNSPWALKESLRFYTGDLNDPMINPEIAAEYASVGSDSESYRLDDVSQQYVINDPVYYSELVDKPLVLDHVDATNNMRFIHLMGSHEPYTMNEDAQLVPKGESSEPQQTQGSFKIVMEYINQLKAMDLYNNSNIFIMADHGTRDPTPYPEYASAPIMMVKPAETNEHHFSGAMKISEAPVSHVDFQETFLDLAGVPHSNMGRCVFDIPENEKRVREFRYQGPNDDPETSDEIGAYIKLYKIHGHALDLSTWEKTDVRWAG